MCDLACFFGIIFGLGQLLVVGVLFVFSIILSSLGVPGTQF